MKLYKPKFWHKNKNFFSILLFPITLIYLCIIKLRKMLISKKQFKIPIICIGNIYIGGTGKTPTSIYVANQLLKNSFNPVIIRKYYNNHHDEYELIKNYFKNLIINENRSGALIEAENSRYDLAILDDGFQDYKIKKDLNIICFNSKQLIGNGLVIPSGPLREDLSVLKDAHIILINGEKNSKFEEKIIKINKNLKIFYSYFKPINLDEFKNHKLLAIAGIGNPENFFEILEKNNLKVFDKIVLPDHYVFSKKEIENIINKAKKDNLKLIMTEKDFYKIKKFKFENLSFLKISLEIEDKQNFIDTIKNKYEKKH